MVKLERSMDYDDALLAEIYDQEEVQTEDVNLLRRLLQGSSNLDILECFSGTGRILIPLAKDGHRITGIEIAEAMTTRAASKLAALSKEIRERTTLVVGDTLMVEWGKRYDVVVLGGNCLFELSSPEVQEECIRRASEALIPGGRVFVDNGDIASGMAPSDIGSGWTALEGTGADGTYGRCSVRVVDVDISKGIEHYVRTWYKRSPDGTETLMEYTACKHPVSGDDVEGWLQKHDFEILSKFGDRKGSPYRKGYSGRAIFWARKR